MTISSSALYDYLSVDLDSAALSRVEQSVAADALRKSLLKKFQDDIDLKATSAAALDAFKLANIRCSEWSYRCESMLDEYLLGHFSEAVWQFFDDDSFRSDLTSVLQHGRFGPGASIGARGEDFYTKSSDSLLTCTSPGIYRAYSSYVSTIPYWRASEIIRACVYGEVDIVEGSKLSFVPKNNAVARSICTEPSLNMFAQLGYGKLIEDRLKRRYSIDLSDQPDINAALARRGSVDQSYFTIDLSMASDSISLNMLERFVPPHVVSMLEALRSPVTTTPNGEEIVLHMVSSMGNGFTFPLQTALFCCAVDAAFRTDNTPMRRVDRAKGTLPNFGVFGDDIIGPNGLYDKVARLLELLGFTVNTEKSFSDGFFRESCGSDYYLGFNVRGVYIKSLKTDAARYVAINRLNEWSAQTGILLPRTISYLVSKTRRLFVPLHESDDSGIRVPISYFNQRGRPPVKFGRFYYRSLEPKGRRLRIEDGRVRVPKGARHRRFNPAGLINAFLGGYIRYGSISLRQVDKILPGTTRKFTVNWDFLQDTRNRWEEPETPFQVLYRRLVTAILFNVEDLDA